MRTNAVFSCKQKTPFGQLAVLWSITHEKIEVSHILLPQSKTFTKPSLLNHLSNLEPNACLEINSFLNQIVAFLNGEDVRFSLDIICLDLCSPFQQKVLRATHGIPRGFVSTYQLVAKYLGHPKAARAVGMALAANPFPILIPCHRVISSNGTLGGYQGGLPMKRALLKMEGVLLNNLNQVSTSTFFYEDKKQKRFPFYFSNGASFD